MGTASNWPLKGEKVDYAIQNQGHNQSINSSSLSPIKYNDTGLEPSLD